MTTYRKITYKNGAWIQINFVDGEPMTYEVSREHGVGVLLQQAAEMILLGFEGCLKFDKLETEINSHL